MKTKPELELGDAERMLAAARTEAERHGWAVSIAIVDDGGHLLAFARLDGASPASARIAQDKARAAALGRRETKAYEDMINGGRTAFLSAPLNGLLEGGVPVAVGGRVAGAIGVSGVKSEQDALVARAGTQSVADGSAREHFPREDSR
jgi:glc operon protein GlcG